VYGQVDTLKQKTFGLWFNHGLNISSPYNFEFLIGVQAGLNFSLNEQHFFKLKGYVCLAPNDFLDFSNEIKPNRLLEIYNLSFMYGFSKYKNNFCLIVPYIGISCGYLYYRGKYLYSTHRTILFTSTSNPQYEHDNSPYIGLPLEVSFIFAKPIVGMSVDFYANIHKHSDFGIKLNMLIGKIRTKQKQRSYKTIID
jgi:hypothetical protein